MEKAVKDKVFADKKKAEDFTFDQKVVDVFDDMVERSVPFYEEMQRMAVELAASFAQDGTNVYDLGCSTGTTLIQLNEKLKDRDVRFVGIDSSPSMLERARLKLKEHGCLERCDFKCADLNQSLILDNPSVAILVLSLQFVRPIQRETLIKQIFEAMNPGGCVIVIEKILANDSLTNRLFIDYYYEYKKRRGYTELEIAQKREALENVLIPYRLDENVMLLRRNGFAVVETFFKWYNFTGLIGIKP